MKNPDLTFPVDISLQADLAKFRQHRALSDRPDEALIRSADRAMYCIKRAGKNNFGFVNAVKF